MSALQASIAVLKILTNFGRWWMRSGGRKSARRLILPVGRFRHTFKFIHGRIGRMHKNHGFTLLEVIVVVAIVSVLITLAAPSLKFLIQSNAMSSTVNTFLSDMRYARNESIKRSGNVVLCRSDAPESVNPSCDGGGGPGGNGWVSGWIVFHDLDSNGARAATEPILRAQSPITSVDSIVESGTPVNKFRFTATGRLGLSSATSMQFGGSNFINTAQRMVCVNLGGRGRIAGDGLSACGVDQ